MTERVYVHVGPFKTGTTYVQGLLTNNAERLAEAGVLFPRGSWKTQARGVRDLMGKPDVPSTGRSVEGEWQRVVDEVHAWGGPTAVLSNETISKAGPREVKRVLRSLRGLEVHLVYTARDLSRVIPAMWQTGLRSRQDYTWEEYVGAVRDPRTGGPWGERFWQSQDAPDVLGRWSRHLPVEQVHVVTVPRPGSPPELLWQRFCTVPGVDPSGHDLEVERSNVSLGTAEAELLRRVNAAARAAGVGNQPWLKWIRQIATRVLEPAPDKLPFTLPEEDFGWVHERSLGIVDGLRRGGFPVVGDLDELVPVPPDSGTGRHPTAAPEAATLDAAVDAVVLLVAELGEREQQARSGMGGKGRRRHD